MKKAEKILIIIGIIFISFNLRAPITSVGSIIDLIKNEFELSGSMSGFITTLPLIAFAIFSPFVSKIISKFGYGLTMLGGLVFIIVGELIRSYTNSIGLFLGTIFIGIGIAIGNVLIPSIIKLKFSKKVGVITSIYTTSMCIFAAVGSGASVPLANGLSFGWRNALAVWAILTVITILIWLPQLTKSNQSKSVCENKNNIKKGTSIWKSPLAWWVTLFMGTQSLLFYCLVAWLPSIISSRGMSPQFAGMMTLLFQLVSLPATLLMPIIADKFKDQKVITAISSLIYLVGMLLLLVANSQMLIIISLIFTGLGMGGSISLSITFISLRSANAKRAAELSGMSQSAGYLLAAVGPLLVGFIFDLTASFTIPIIVLILFVLFLIYVGIYASKNEVIE